MDDGMSDDGDIPTSLFTVCSGAAVSQNVSHLISCQCYNTSKQWCAQWVGGLRDSHPNPTTQLLKNVPKWPLWTQKYHPGWPTLICLLASKNMINFHPGAKTNA